MRIVFDTNVLLAGMLTRGVCEALLDHCVASQAHELFLSQHILDEFLEHAAKFKASPSEIREAQQFLTTYLTLVDPIEVAHSACRDPDDLPVLGTALAAKADFLVTGDKDLLILKSFKGITIGSPRALYTLLVPPESA